MILTRILAGIMKDLRSTKKKRALTRQRNALIRQVDDKTYDKKNKKALTRPKIKIKTNSNRPVEVISVSRFKTTARFADTNTFDLLYFQDKSRPTSKRRIFIWSCAL